MPVCAQDSDVTKYIEGLRAQVSAPRDVKGEAKQLLADFTKRLETTTEPARRADLYFNMSGLQRTLGDPAAALTSVRTARSLQPDNQRIALGLASELLENGQIGEVPALLGVDPTDGQALLHKANELGHSHPDLAVYCGELAHQLIPQDAIVTDELGTLYLRQGKTAEASNVFLQAVAGAPQVAQYHYDLALSMLLRRRNDDARTQLLTALECHPLDDERASIQAALLHLDSPKK